MNSRGVVIKDSYRVKIDPIADLGMYVLKEFIELCLGPTCQVIYGYQYIPGESLEDSTSVIHLFIEGVDKTFGYSPVVYRQKYPGNTIEYSHVKELISKVLSDIINLAKE